MRHPPWKNRGLAAASGPLPRQSDIPSCHENDCAEGALECGGLTPP
jgi:hypothetical protein